MQHPSIKNQKVVDKVVSRRGRLHAFNTLNPFNTALIIIDMTVGFVQEDQRCQAIIPSINDLADKMRTSGGTVAWVTTRSDHIQQQHIDVFGHHAAAHFHQQAQISDPASDIYPSLNVQERDIQATKLGYSAFFPGKANLHEQLQERAIDTVIICGTVTNICCESSARDAVELGYKTILAADLNIGQAHGLHEATLTTFYRAFGDVRTFAELSKLLSANLH